MDMFWGAVIAAIGLLFVRWGRTQSDFIVYRLLVARSQLLWRGRVHAFFQISGAAMMVFGLLFAALS